MDTQGPPPAEKPDWLLASIGGMLFCGFAIWTLYSALQALTTGYVTVNSLWRGKPMLSVPWREAWGLFFGQFVCLAGAALWFVGALTNRILTLLSIALMISGGLVGALSGILASPAGIKIAVGTIIVVAGVQYFETRWKARRK